MLPLLYVFYSQGGKDDKKDDKKGGKDKKKKGEPDVELVELPPEVTTLATFQMTLEDFLEGEFELEETFVHSLVEGDSEEKVVESESSSKKVRTPRDHNCSNSKTIPDS